MVNLNGVTSKPADGGKVTLTRKCPLCSKEHSLTVKQEELLLGMNALSCGARIQDAFPNWAPTEREMLMSGICDACWDRM